MMDKQLLTTPILAAALGRIKFGTFKRTMDPGTASRDTGRSPQK